MRFLGNIEPKYGRWAWPFRAMEPGDWFTVKHADRDPGLVAQMAYVRATQMGKRFSVDKDFQPGLLKVECVPPTSLDKHAPEAIIDVMNWGMYEKLVRTHTDIEPNGTHGDYQNVGSSTRWPCQYVKPLGKQKTFVYSVDDRYVRVDFEPAEMVLTRLANPTTASELIEAEVEELMS